MVLSFVIHCVLKINQIVIAFGTNQYCMMLFYSHSDLVYVPHKATRQLLSQWVDGELDDELLSHLHILLSTHCPKLLTAVQNSTCPENYAWLIKDLSKLSPATSLCPPAALPLLHKMLAEQLTDPDLGHLSQTSPFLFKIWAEDLLHLGWVKDVLSSLGRKSEMLNQCQPHPLFHYHAEETGYFPHMPVTRNRGVFTLDEASKSIDKPCTKNSSGHPSLLPGLFTLHCPHSK